MTKLALLVAILGLALAASAEPRIGEPAPDFTATDISGHPVKLSDYRGKIVVLETFGWQNPRTRQEYNSGTAPLLQHRLASNGVVYLILNPGLDHLTPADAKKTWVNRKMEITDWIIDGPGVPLTQLYGLKSAGQMFVIDKEGVLAYAGEMDDTPSLGASPRGAKNYVLRCVMELQAGKKVSRPRVPVRELAPDDSPIPQIGQPAPDFIATDIDGQMFRLSDYKGKIVILESTPNCISCQVHYVSGAAQELQRELTAKGVVWLLVEFPDHIQWPPVGVRQTPATARQEWADRKMAITDWIIDWDGTRYGTQVGRRYGMKTNPEAFVIARDGTLAYQGAIDNFYEVYQNEFRATLGGPGTPLASLSTAAILDLRARTVLGLDPRKTRNYIREAVDALLAGKRVQVPETKPYGCPLVEYFGYNPG